MQTATRFLLHHGEAVDPTLIDWIRHKIDDILGVGPGVIVFALALGVVAFPVVLVVLAVRRRRRLER